MKTLQRNEIKEVNQPRGKSQVKDESQVQFLFDVSKVKDCQGLSDLLHKNCKINISNNQTQTVTKGHSGKGEKGVD